MGKVNEVALLVLTAFSAGFIADVFFISKATLDYGSDARLAAFVILWLLIGKFLKFTSIETFKLTFVLVVVLSFLFVFFKDHPSIERVASWVYVYLAVGIIQQLVESRKQKQHVATEN